MLSKWNLFCFGQIAFNFSCTFAAHHLLLTYLINLSLEKESVVLVKSLMGKVC